MAAVRRNGPPLIKHKLALMRDKTTGVKEFREAAAEIAMLISRGYRDLPLKEITIGTPVAGGALYRLFPAKKIALVPILRHQVLGMVEGILEMIPAAKVSHIGLYRNPETSRSNIAQAAEWHRGSRRTAARPDAGYRQFRYRFASTASSTFTA